MAKLSDESNMVLMENLMIIETDNLTLPPCNHSPYDKFSYVIRVPLMVPVITLGLAANFVNFLIYKHPSMRSSMVNWYLLALTFSDAGILAFSFLMLSLPVVLEQGHRTDMYNIAVITQRWVYAPAMMIQTTCVSLLVLISGYRLLGIKYPFIAQRVCSPTKVKSTIYLVVLLAIAFNLTRFFELEARPCDSMLNDSTSGLLLIASSLRHDSIYYTVYIVCAYTLINFMIPFVFLTVTNILIAKAVGDSYKLRKTMALKTSVSKLKNQAIACESPALLVRQASNMSFTSTVTSSIEEKTKIKENKITIMLITIVFVFLIANSLALINNIMEMILKSNMEKFDILQSIYSTMVELSNLLIVLNSASTIFIYWTFSAKYRMLFKYYAFVLKSRRGKLTNGDFSAELRLANGALVKRSLPSSKGNGSSSGHLAKKHFTRSKVRTGSTPRIREQEVKRTA